jgi:hypothetical protein
MKAFTYGAACAAVVGLIWAGSSMVSESSEPKSKESAAEVSTAEAKVTSDKPKVDPHRARDALKALAANGSEGLREPSTMSPEEIQAELTALESDLEKQDAIARLNRDDADEEERAEFGETMLRTALLRHALAERDVDVMVQEVDAYARIHAERVAQIMAESEADQ